MRNQERGEEWDKQDIQELPAKEVIKIMMLNTVMSTLKWNFKSTVQMLKPTAVRNALCTLTRRANPLMSFIHFQVS